MAKRRRVRRDWADLVRAQPGSGLTVRAFCQQAGVSSSQFYRWRRRGAALEPPVETPVAGFVQLQPVDDHPLTPSGVTLVGIEGWRLEVAAGFDRATLEQVLTCLAARRACSR
ncbi:MAG: IS66 family insertion sequence element accessory protein TnpB [Candidatus Latescibacterota bacterium]